MAASVISRVRMRDLTRLGRSRIGGRAASGPPTMRPLRDSESSPRPSGHRKRLAAAPQSGQLTPRTYELTESSIL